MIAFITVVFLLLFYIVMLVSEVPFFLVVISGIPFAFFVYFVVFALDFNESCYPRYCYLSYKQFKHFHLVNPSRFIYNEDGNKLYFRDNGRKRIQIKFHFISLIKFYIMKIIEKRMAKKEERNKNILVVLQTVQGDINHLKNKAKEEIEDANNIMKTVRQNESNK